MKQRRRHSYSIGWDEWLPKHIFNELGHLDNIYHKFPSDKKLFILHNVIYRLFILRLLKTYDLIFEQITSDYQEFNNVVLDDYYNHFRNDLEDPNSYILELSIQIVQAFFVSYDRMILCLSSFYQIYFNLRDIIRFTSSDTDIHLDNAFETLVVTMRKTQVYRIVVAILNSF